MTGTDLIALLLLLLHLLLVVPPTAKADATTNVPGPRLNRRHCYTFYEHAGMTSSTTIEGIVFAGVVEHGSSAPHVGVFDTPLYDGANIPEAQLIGRLMGSFWPHVAEANVEDNVAAQQALHSGLWNFNFEGGWISASLGFGPNNTSTDTPNIVIGGTGEYSGYIGTVEHEVVNSDPFVISYTICPPSPFSVMEIETKCVECVTWDSSQPSVVGNRSFTGDISRGDDNHVGVLENPAFDSLEAAQTQNVDEGLIGRNLGVYFPNSLQSTTALFNFQFFPESSFADDDDDNEADWIATSFGFSFETPLGAFTADEQPNVILGGSGKYSGIVGTIEDTVEEFDPAPEGEFSEVNYYKICSDGDPFPAPIVEEECTIIYELSKSVSFTVGGYNFSGSELVGEDDHLGIFNTPFFLSPDVENSTLKGRIMGHYFLNERGAATGQWNFHFFGGDEDDGEVPSGWLTGNLGFGEGDYPDVIVGGSGDWKGFQGRIRPAPLSTDPLIISWIICPEGKGFAGGSADNGFESMATTGQSTAGGNESPTSAPTAAYNNGVNVPPSAARGMQYFSLLVPCILGLLKCI